MKKYSSIIMIVESSSDRFLDKLSAAIEEHQGAGMQVEVQYHPTVAQLTALVLIYEN